MNSLDCNKETNETQSKKKNEYNNDNNNSKNIKRNKDNQYKNNNSSDLQDEVKNSQIFIETEDGNLKSQEKDSESTELIKKTNNSLYIPGK